MRCSLWSVLTDDDADKDRMDNDGHRDQRVHLRIILGFVNDGALAAQLTAFLITPQRGAVCIRFKMFVYLRAADVESGQRVESCSADAIVDGRLVPAP